MTAEKKTSNVPIEQFIGSRQAILFQTLKQPQLSGQLWLTDTNNTNWTFYIYLGRIVYATGGYHSVRRWRRHILAHVPTLAADFSKLFQEGLQEGKGRDLEICWEYELLHIWVEKGAIPRDKVAQIIHDIVVEIFFDLNQSKKVIYEFSQDTKLSTQLVLIDPNQVIVEAWKSWQAWHGAKLSDRSPNSAPVIKNDRELQERTSPKVYQVLHKIMENKQTLRDISIQTKRDLLQLTRSLMPYIQLGIIELEEIPDLPNPVTPSKVTAERPQNVQASAPLIACIDDSPLICQTMEKIVKEAGYRFISVQDPLRAIAVLLTRKPALIFLDLVMPNANGYEICSQLRKITVFRNTPIVILTGNDGLVDRVRAKMVGSTDFISKPVKADIVLNMINIHLHQKSMT